MEIKSSIEVIEQLFHIFNVEFFESNLVKPVLTLNPSRSKKNKIYGWCSTKRIWIDKDSNDLYYEINICPEFLDLAIYDVSATLIHEMVHLLNLQEGIKDCSRNGSYHNKKFKTTAEKRGLEIGYDKSIGWSVTTLNETGRKFIEKNINLQIPPLIRGDGSLDCTEEDDQKAKKRKKTSFKYICPVCNNSVRATKIVEVKCISCDEKMNEEPS